MNLTAVIVCRSKRGKVFGRALKSIRFANEVLVIELPKIVDYAGARNEALKLAKCDWVLFVDADEVISRKLGEEIQHLTNKNDVVGYYFKRRDRFLGRWLNHGETAGVRLLRLAKRGIGKWERPVHEVWKINGKVRRLKNPILHYSHENVLGMIRKLDRYSDMEARYRRRKIQKLRMLSLLKEIGVFPVGKFILNYFIRLGFLDGMEGFIFAGMMSWHSFLVRAKLSENAIS